jgi:7tm Chemosensory receptor
MKQRINKFLDILFHFFGISHLKVSSNLDGKVVSFCALIVNLCLMTFSISFTLQKVLKQNFEEMIKSYVKVCIFVVFTITTYFIQIQAWKCGNVEKEIERNLKKVDEILSEDFKTKISKKVNWLKVVLNVLDEIMFEIIPVIICFALSLVPLFLDEPIGLWEILLYSTFLIKLASFHYVITVGKFTERFVKINEQLEEIVVEDEKYDLTFARFMIVVANRQILWKISLKVEKLMKSYTILYDSVKLFNRRFGFSIFMIIFSAFLSITYCGFNFFIEIETNRANVVIVGKNSKTKTCNYS